VTEAFLYERRSADAAIEMFILSGELDSSVAPALRAEIRRIFEDGDPHWVVFDLAGVDFVDSIGIGVFFATHRMCERSGAAVALASPKPAVRQTLESTGIARVLLLTPTRADALIYFSRAAHGHTDALEQARDDAAGI
jgi:anti-sigma B factor antagonist